VSIIHLIDKGWYCVYGIVCSFLCFEAICFKVYWPLLVLIPCALYGFYRSSFFQKVGDQKEKS